jgi:hypothetical protein
MFDPKAGSEFLYSRTMPYPEDCIMNMDHCENLKSHAFVTICSQFLYDINEETALPSDRMSSTLDSLRSTHEVPPSLVADR